MAISEENRHEMYRRFEETWGLEVATTLMEHLPPVGWADVATKRDLEHLGTTLRLEWHADLHRELRLQLLALVTAMVALNGVSTGLIIGLLR